MFSIWSQCFNFIRLGPCVFKPFSILPLMSTPLVLILHGRRKTELANAIWPTQLPSIGQLIFPPLYKHVPLTWVTYTEPTREKLYNGNIKINKSNKTKNQRSETENQIGSKDTNLVRACDVVSFAIVFESKLQEWPAPKMKNISRVGVRFKLGLTFLFLFF
jgi:hypothetical protein